MKFFLQDCRTAKFMRCDSTWSADINEALDFLSERRATFFGLKDSEDSFRILKVGAKTLLPPLIPQLILSKIPCAHLPVPLHVAGHHWEQILPPPSQLGLPTSRINVQTFTNHETQS
jgi:hypothetical protein